MIKLFLKHSLKTDLSRSELLGSDSVGGLCMKQCGLCFILSVSRKLWSNKGCTGRGRCGPGVHGQRSEGARVLSPGRGAACPASTPCMVGGAVTPGQTPARLACALRAPGLGVQPYTLHHFPHWGAWPRNDDSHSSDQGNALSSSTRVTSARVSVASLSVR